MTGAKRPSFQFYPDDWLSDTELQLCSLAAQGLWIKMLCIMHKADPYGHLKSRKGEAISTAQLGRLAGEPVGDLLTELDSAGVFSLRGDGTIYSRRMVHDFKKWQERSDEGRRAANIRWHGDANPMPSDDAEGDAEPMHDGFDPHYDPMQTECSPSPTPTPTPSSTPNPTPKKGTVAQSPPTLDEVSSYMLGYMKKKNAVGPDPAEAFVDHFSSNGWKVSGRAPMRDWKAAARTWVRNNIEWGKLRVETTPDSDEWLYESYRRVDLEKHGEDPDWQCYIEWASDYCTENGPRTAPTFNEFKKGDAE